MSWNARDHHDEYDGEDDAESRDPDVIPDGDYEVTGTLELVTPDWIQICHENGCVQQIGVEPALPLEPSASGYVYGEITIPYSLRTRWGEQHAYAREQDVIEALGDRFKPAASWTRFTAAEAMRRR